MIASLRAGHRRIIYALVVLLPLLIFLALSARQQVPAVDELPAASTRDAQP